MNAPLDIDRGPEHHIQPQRQEHSMASIEAICEEEEQRADRIAVKEARRLIAHYKRLAEYQRNFASQPAVSPITRMSMERQATDYERFAHELSGLIRT